MVKLSELEDEIEIVTEGYGKVTVGDVKWEIENGDDASLIKWYLPIDRKWKPNAEYMLSNYIENEEGEMYEGWYEKARDRITPQLVARIQTVLEETFSNENVRDYWEYGEQIEIDIMPPKSEPA